MCYDIHMDKLSNPRVTSEIIKKYGFGFRKRFGQNFLTDAGVLEQIIEAAQITKEDLVIEIGPGIGTLTQYLAQAAGKVISIEIDSDLIPILNDTLADCRNVEIINKDVLKVDLRRLAGENLPAPPETAADPGSPQGCPAVSGAQAAEGGSDPGHLPALRNLKIVANLPYYITTPILMGLFENHVPAKSITVMVQKEVADRMQAQSGSKDYGSLSLAVQYYAKPEVAVYVPPECFMPRPKVASAVINLHLYDTPPVKVRDEALLFSIIKAAFSQRRKTLVNAVGTAQQIPFDKPQVAAALGLIKIPVTIRGEALTLGQFAQLTDALR